MTRAAWRDECGAAAGFEALPLGLLVFVIGVLLIANAWAVVDAKIAVTAAAREAARAYVEAEHAAAAAAAGMRAAEATMRAHGRPGVVQASFTGVFTRCARVTWTVTERVPLIALPWVPWAGALEASAAHAEVVDPLRAGVPGEAGCVGRA